MISPDMDPAFAGIYQRCRTATMTSCERAYALYQAVRYLTDAGIDGAFVECGVWKGGSVMIMAETLRLIGAAPRDLVLYDTFDGMTQPGERDIALTGESAASLLATADPDDPASIWCKTSLEEVRRTVASTGYPMERVHFVPGPVEETLPAAAPETIALLRLDTDWYDSTRHELVHLFPRLRPGGVLIIDDYGHWSGAKQAVDEYFSSTGLHILLNRIDYTGRIGIKCK